MERGHFPPKVRRATGPPKETNLGSQGGSIKFRSARNHQ